MPLPSTDIARLSQLLDEAQAMLPNRREAWLAALPHRERHLAEPLRDMLARATALERSGDGPLSRLPTLGQDESVGRPGEQVGPYRLIREIGHGGMGTVWLADRADGTLKRQVALKLPRLTWDAGLAARIARERDIDALLEHPHIARLYDAGVDALGRPFLALEYIAGTPIDQWCQTQALTVAQRLRLFVLVVRAVAYAHGRLVVHRDLKPSNVLVTADGQPHLLDFGIAKRLEAAATHQPELTQYPGRPLTPHYASPEQVAGETITVRADVYSLGVLLYELLTGQLPHAPRRATLHAVEDAILQGDAPSASSRVADLATRRALKGEVDAILAKAMKREPAERYATADALADDIERHLRGDPVSARPDSTWYRLRKAAVRHRWGVAAGAAVAMAVLVGGGTALRQAQRAANEAERARLATEFVADMFRASSRSGAAKGDAAGSGPASTEPLLDHGARLIEARFPRQPAMQAELYGVLGRVYADIGAGQLAMAYAQRQVRLLEALPFDRPAQVRAWLLLADTALTEGLDRDAEAHAAKAVAVAAGDAELEAAALAQLALVQISHGKLDAAGDTAQRAGKLWPERPDTASLTAARLRHVRAALLEKSNRFDDSLADFQRAIAMAMAAEGPRSRTAVGWQLKLAWALVGRSRATEARAPLDAALATLRTGSVADTVKAAIVVAEHDAFLFDMGVLSHAQAVATIEKSRSALRDLATGLPPVLMAKLDFSMAFAHLSWGDLQSAEPLMSGSAPIIRASTQSLATRQSLASLEGILAMGLGQHAAADAALRERLEIRRALGRGQMPFAAYDWVYVALNLVMQGQSTQALQWLAKAPRFGAEAGDRLAGDGYADATFWATVRAHLDGGNAAAAWGAMSGRPMNTQPSASPELGSHALRGEVLCAAHRPAEGLPRLLESIERSAQVLADFNPGLARLRAAAGLCALKLGQRALAMQLAEQARQAFTRQPGVSPYYKAPLFKLEQALGLQPPPV